MATKKATSAAKKPSASKTSTAKKTTVTTVTAVSAKTKPASRLFGYPLSRAPLLGALIAEFIGTFLLTAVVIGAQGQPLYVAFALVGIVLIIGGLSGAHVNPAISVGAWLTRKIKGTRALLYIIAQVLGALLAFVVLSAYVGGAAPVDPQAALYGQQAASLFHANAIPSGKEWYVLFGEIIGTTILAFAVATALREKKEKTAAAFTVGLGILVALIVAGTATSFVGGSTIINPAVASALGTIDWNALTVWPFVVYFFAPLVGGVLGFVIADTLRVESDGGDDHIVVE